MAIRNTSGKIDGEAAFGEIDNTKFKGEIWYFKIIPNDVFWMIAFEGYVKKTIIFLQHSKRCIKLSFLMYYCISFLVILPDEIFIF